MKSFIIFICAFISGLNSLNAAPFAYVTNYNSNLISIVDIGIATAVGYVDNNSFNITHPVHILNSPNAQTTYVIADTNNAVFRIDSTLNKIVAQVNPNGFPFQSPSAMSYSEDSKKCYVTNEAGNNVSIIDVATDTVIGYVTVPLAFPFNVPNEIVVAQNKAYVTNNAGNNVSIIDLATDTVVGYVNTPLAFPFNTPYDIATVDLTSAYVTNFNGNNTSIIDIATDTVTGYINDALFPTNQPTGVFVNNNQLNGMICDFGSHKVSVINVPAEAISQYVTGTFDDPRSVHYPLVGNLALVSNFGNNTVSIVDITTFTVTGIVDASFFPFSAPLDIEIANIILVPLGPPTNLCARKMKDTFADQTNLINLICWQPPLGLERPVSYAIYRNADLTVLAGIVPDGCKLCFKDNHRRKKSINDYYIVAIGASGETSPPAFIRVVRD